MRLPSGIACTKSLLQSWIDAYATDIYSPFGGIVAFNRKLPKDVAQELSKNFLEVIIAPGFSKDARTIFYEKKNLRLLELKGLEKKCKRNGLDLRSVVGGFLVQERDVWFTDQKTWKIVTKIKPTKEDLISMDFALKCVKHVKSNSVVFVKGTRTVVLVVDKPHELTQPGLRPIKAKIISKGQSWQVTRSSHSETLLTLL